MPVTTRAHFGALAGLAIGMIMMPIGQAAAVTGEADGAEQATPNVLRVAPQMMTYAGPELGTFPLYAGQNILVGEVKVTSSGNNVTVTYKMTTPGWCMSETHLYVGTEEPDWRIGRYPYGDDDLGCTTEASYTFQLTDCTLSWYLAAHAVVENWDIPVGAYTTYRVAFQGNRADRDAYFLATLENVQYPAYCVDLGRTIQSNRNYNCSIYSSLDANLPDGVVDRPQNLDLVNYVNTQYDVAAQTYTKGDGVASTPVDYRAVQGAIWELIDTTGDCDTYTGSINWNKAQCNEIVADAKAYGEGFVPGEGDKIKFLAACKNAQTTAIVAQVTGIDVDVDGTYLGEETAWALNGGTRWRQGWGEYHTLTCPAP